MSLSNKHDTVLVPIESWAYNSPHLLAENKTVDLGLLAEALLYYDHIYINLSTSEQLCSLIEWFTKHSKIDLLISLIEEKTIQFFYYQFMSTVVNNNGVFSAWNLDFPMVNDQSDFLRLIVYKADLSKYMHTHKKARLLNALENNIITELPKEYDIPIENARIVFKDEKRMRQLAQAYVDGIYNRFRPHIDAPHVECNIQENTVTSELNIKYNIDITKLLKEYPNIGGFRPEMPLIGEVNSNRLIWTASNYGWDLYLGDVLSSVVGNKLYEIDTVSIKPQKIIKQLNEQVEFPDVRELVNNGKLDINTVLEIRREGILFRKWLQTESSRDRNAIIAYHREVAKSLGFNNYLGSTFRIFGALGILAVPFVQAYMPTTINPQVSATAALGGTFLYTVGEQLTQKWKPVIFGDWLFNKINKLQS